MSCGKRLDFGYEHDKREMTDRIREDAGIDYHTASKIERGECLNDFEMRHAESALRDIGFESHIDYNKRDCHCDHGDY